MRSCTAQQYRATLTIFISTFQQSLIGTVLTSHEKHYTSRPVGHAQLCV